MDLFSNSGAFVPFYRDMVAVEGNRGTHVERGLYAACVFDQGYDDPLAEGDAESSRRSITLQISRNHENGWISGGPKKGDLITLECGARFKVRKVSMPMGEDFMLEARSV